MPTAPWRTCARWVAIWEWWEGRFTLSRLFEWPEKPEVDALESTQAQAEAGTDDAAANSTRMTPRRVLQAILALSPFTSTLATKLAGIETGAQVNPQHFIRFAAEDADTLPASDLQDGEIGLYGSDGTTQHQSGDIADIGTIYLPKSAADFGQDAANPGTDLDAYDTTRMFRWIVDNPGASVIVSLTERGSTNTVFFQVDQIAPYGTTGYRLSSLTHLRGGHTPESSGVSWNVTATLTFAVGTKDILDLVDTLAKYVLRTDLEGHDSDEFASYSNGLFGSNYFPGNFCLFTGTTQPTDDTRAIRGPDIATGSGVLVWGDLRADSNPDTAWTPEALVAADWPSGRIIHVSPWHPFNNDGHIRITLTSAASLVGTGNAAHLWAQASWTVVGSLTPTLQSDYYRWSENVPSDLDAEFPPSVIPNAPWVAPTGTSKTDATLSVEDKLLLDTGDDVPIGELYEHHDLFHTGLAELAGYNYVTNSSPPNAGDVYVAGPVGVNTGNYSIKPASDDDKALLKAVIRAGKRVRYAVSATRYVEFKPGGLPAELFGRIFRHHSTGQRQLHSRGRGPDQQPCGVGGNRKQDTGQGRTGGRGVQGQQPQPERNAHTWRHRTVQPHQRCPLVRHRHRQRPQAIRRHRLADSLGRSPRVYSAKA